MKYPWYYEFLRLPIPYPAKCVYIAACLEPFSALDVSKLMRMSRNNVHNLFRFLSDEGWLVKRRMGQKILILPTAPKEVQTRYGNRLKDDLKMAIHAGEARMKLLVAELQVSRDFVDNARPESLRSPVTTFNLEVDRLARGQLLWEYRGAQHLGPTRKFPDQKKADAARLNDLLKQGMSVEMGLPLIVVYKPDLTIEGILRLIPRHIKTWPLIEGPYLEAIREVCREYQAMDTGEDSLPGLDRAIAERDAAIRLRNLESRANRRK